MNPPITTLSPVCTKARVLMLPNCDTFAQYLPPVSLKPGFPPQTIISLPVQTAVCWSRASGALAVLVAVQLLVVGLYLLPVLRPPRSTNPPQTIISPPV